MRDLVAWLVSWARDRMHSMDWIVVVVGTTVRVAGIGSMLYAIPMVWSHFRRPGLAVVLAVGLSIETGVVVALWLRDRAVRRYTLLIDLPTGVLALVVGGAVAAPTGPIGWTYFVYPYTVMAALALGFACRSVLGTVTCGLIWTAANVATAVGFRDAPALAVAIGVAPSYLANPTIGWLVAREQRRVAVELEQARARAMRRAGDLATARERARHARALHDRVLQTLEALVRDELVTDPRQREDLVEQAAWLRSYVERGAFEVHEDLATGLEAATRAARRAGVRVELNDGRLRASAALPELPADKRETLVEATHQLLSALGSGGGPTVVRVVPEGRAVLVTILSAGQGVPPDLARISRVRDCLTAAGGSLVFEPAPPYLEARVPTE